ncbi:MAG: hypothetical protein ABJN24_01335 [Hyphomicrobiales bacterium]
MKRTLSIAAGLVLTATTVFAQELPKTDESLTAWYAALQKPDAIALEALMAPEDFVPFQYEIKDFEVTQNRKEFIASMDEWLGAISGGTIEYKITDAYEGGYNVLVCYRFVESELLAAEAVGVYDTKITGVSQAGKGDKCTGF